MKISDIQAREIFDSRGIPTIECDVILDDGMIFTSCVPSDISHSPYQAHERRDGGKRLQGFGVRTAVDTIQTIIAPLFIGKKPSVIDADIHMLEMDNTDNKSRLGANSMFAVSMSMAKAQAYHQRISLYELIAELCGNKSVSLPVPCFTLFSSEYKQLMIVPTRCESFHHAMDMAAKIFYTVRGLLEKRNAYVGISDSGGYVSAFNNLTQICDLAMEAIHAAGLSDNVQLALDVTASHLYNKDTDTYAWEGTAVSREELVEQYKQLLNKYPFVFINDGLCYDDLSGWRYMTDELCALTTIAGDDIFATDSRRIWEGIEIGCATSAVIKPHQIGTLTEALQVVNLCQEYDWGIIASCSTGETNDVFISDFAVGVGAHYIKAGGFARGERIAKYNRLLHIESEMFL